MSGMEKLHLVLASVALLAGCAATAPRAPDNWAVEFSRAGSSAAAKSEAKPQFPAVRVASVSVRAPYDAARFAVLRADGSVAFDGYNQFAASPAALLRGAVQDAMEASGRFARVAAPTSSEAVPLSAEVTVTRLALDCREKGRRAASVALSVVLIDARRAAVATGRGEGSATVAAKDFSAAFSGAFASAMDAALAAAAASAAGTE